MVTIRFDTLEDARVWFENSGYLDWKFFNGFSEEKLVEFLYRNSDGVKTITDLMKEFLLLNGQDLNHYIF